MFSHYKVVYQDQEEVLILYVDDFYEFASDQFRKNGQRSLYHRVREYIKDHHIVFKGIKVMLVIGGVTLGTLFIYDHQPLERTGFTYVDTPIVEKMTSSFSVTESLEENDHVSKIEENTEIKDLESIDHGNLNEETTKEEEKGEESSGNQTESSDREELKIMLYHQDGSVEVIGLEEYLIGVLAAEMPASFPIEALKAQAIASRTYTLKKLAMGEKITIGSSTQNYINDATMQREWKEKYQYYKERITKAVQETKGVTMTYQGEYIEALYHSTSNGKTEDARMVWGYEVPYLKSVDSPWDVGTMMYHDEVAKNFEELSRILGISFDQSSKIEVLDRNDSGRVLTIQVKDQVYKGTDFRALLGLRSSDFDLIVDEGKVNFVTRGWGHGVGMSQYGACGMAKEGYSYRDILNHYYNGVTIG